MAIPTTRKQAILEGSAYYKTGTSCIRGHVEKRYTSGGACVQCRKLDEKKRYGQLKKSNTIQKNKDALLAERELDRQFDEYKKQIAAAVAEDRVLYGQILDMPTPESRAHCKNVREMGVKP